MSDSPSSLGATGWRPGSILLRALAANWWLLLLRGLASIVLGVLAFAWPGFTLLTLTLVWGAYTLADGVLALGAAIMGGSMAPRWWLALAGIVGILAGLVAILSPAFAATVLLVIVATWAILVGLLQIWGAIRLRKEIEGEWMLALSGLLALGFGVAILIQPDAGALALVWLIGAYALISGLSFVGLAMRLRRLRA